jgi:glucose/arabinose dehydrogenase
MMVALCLVLSAPAMAEIQREVALQPVVTAGLERPLYVTHAGDGSGRLFVVEQPGRIRIVREGKLEKTPFLDIVDRVRSTGEQGLLGLAFHPAYARNGRYFVNYVRTSNGDTVIAEFRVSDDPDRSQPQERVLLTVPQPYSNHKGGMVEFGPDGFLYLALGDGGAGGDPCNRAQNRDELLGKILRIDVDRGEPYAIPPDNPFAKGGGRPEIFAYGLRNPWRFSFDRKTGLLWAADVGQDEWEEIDLVQLAGNYGWRIMEGAHCFHPRFLCERDGLAPPLSEYGHKRGRCSITGGYVYRGTKIPPLAGAYLYGDYCSGEMFVLRREQAGPSGEPTVLLTTGLRIASFGQDEAGEVYVVGHGGSVHRLVRVVSPPRQTE